MLLCLPSPITFAPSHATNTEDLSKATSAIIFVLWLVWRAINYTMVVLQRAAVSVLHRKFSVTLSLLLLLFYLTVTVSFAYLVFRLRYLTKYSSETTPQKSGKLSVAHGSNLDYVTGEKKRGTDKSKNYLDEFLNAIKVFGYLERPVFHELTKNMTTQKLVGDELFFLDESMGFSIVVEGTMQVYTKMKDPYGNTLATDEKGIFDDHYYDKGDILVVGKQKYHLLNEVKSGAPLCSLLGTLDLFRARNSIPSTSNSDGVIAPENPFAASVAGVGTFYEKAKLSPVFNAVEPEIVESVLYSPFKADSASPDGSAELYPEVVARARRLDGSDTSPATIAIIPSLAFQRIYVKFPKATSHIVATILSRLYKVTFNTVHNYLGLTREIMETEAILNSTSDENKLPEYLVTSVLEELQLKKEKIHTANDKDNYVDDKIHLYAKRGKKPRVTTSHLNSRYVMLDLGKKFTQPGDLLSSVPLTRRPMFSHHNSVADTDEILVFALPKDKSRNFGRNSTQILNAKNMPVFGPAFSDELEETKESTLRASIAENLLKVLGMEEQTDLYVIADDQFSMNSSLTGLLSLMNDYATSSSFNRFLYDQLSEGPHFETVPPLRMLWHLGKVYQTFLRSDFGAGNASETPLPRLGPQKRGPAPVQLRYATVKDAFAQAVEVSYFLPGACLLEQDSFNTGLFYVVHGTLRVTTTMQDTGGSQEKANSVTKKLHSVRAGGVAGYLSSIVGFKSLVTIQSCREHGAVVAYISRKDFVNLLDKFYMLQLPIAAKLKGLLPTLIRTIDFALEWSNIPAGALLASQGDLANGFHIVISGRFRVVRQNTQKTDLELVNGALIDNSNSAPNDHTQSEYEVLGEYGHGQSIGEVEVLTASRRKSSLIAVRDSETARIPRTLFEMLSLQNPAIMVKVLRIVAKRVLESKYRDEYTGTSAAITTSRASEVNSEYKTITILPSVSGLPVREFADKLVQALRAIGRNVIALDQTTTLKHLGRHAFDERLAHLKLSGYFTYLEEKYETIVYVCDTPLKSNWTSTCISQGDCILLLADADDDECATYAGDYERLLLKLKTNARTDLCLIHSEKSVLPGSTSIWLKNRIWVQGHHHINMDMGKENGVKRVKKKNVLFDLAMKLASKANPNIKFQFEQVKSRAMQSLIRLNYRVNKGPEPTAVHKNDFLRLARILSNEAVGLVLGGGGLRGISHVGVVTALEKHGIPVDIIGGTLIGSFVGGLYAKDNNIVSIYGMSKKFSRRVGSIWRNIFDLTYPVTSYITGYEFNRGIWKVFGYHEIEDFWIKYFCNSTNITNSTMEIHERGYAWRFIRASMSLAGLLPPITFNGSMLLDGGYLDNLPVMEMKNRGAKYVIAVDVGSVDDRTPMSYGDTLSGFWVLFNRINPFSKHPNVPNMMDIQLRLAYVASVNALELAKRTPNVIYLRPPIDDYATLDFLKFDEIYNVGLDYADKTLLRWKKEGKFPKIAGLDAVKKCGNSGRRLTRRNSI